MMTPACSSQKNQATSPTMTTSLAHSSQSGNWQIPEYDWGGMAPIIALDTQGRQ